MASWYDQAKIDAAREAQRLGGDDRRELRGANLLSVYNPVSGVAFGSPTYTPQVEANDSGNANGQFSYTPGSFNGLVQGFTPHTVGAQGLPEFTPVMRTVPGVPRGNPGTDSYDPGVPHQVVDEAATAAAYKAYVAKQAAALGLDPNFDYGTLTTANPAGGSHHFADAIYKIGPDGNAVPISALNYYNGPSFDLRNIAKGVGLVGSTLLGGAALGGALGGAGVAGAGAGAGGGAGAAGVGSFGAGGLTSSLVPGTFGAGVSFAAPAGGLSLGGAGLTAGSGVLGGAGALGGAAAGAGAAGTTGSGLSSLGGLASKAGDFLGSNGGKAAVGLLGAAAAGSAGSGPSAGDPAGAASVTDLATQLAARNGQLQSNLDPLYQQLIQSSINQNAKDSARSDALWNNYQADFAPLNTKMAQTAANFDTPERRQQAADQAIAGVNQQFTTARRGLNANLNAGGVDPSAGSASALNAASRIEEAKAAAGAGTTARRGIEATGIGLVSDAARFGQGLPAVGLNTSGSATASGNNAVGLGTQQQQQGNANASTVSGLFGTAANIKNGLFNQSQQVYQNKTDRIGDYLGAAGQIAGAIWSSKKLKDEVGDVDPERAAVAVAKRPIKAWRYKAGAVQGDDGSLRIGGYAEDAQSTTGLGDGTKLDVASENGLNQAALQYLIAKEARRDPKLRKRLAATHQGGGLADARKEA